jgi:hypothetical protein
VRQVGYLPELYEDARTEKYKILYHQVSFIYIHCNVNYTCVLCVRCNVTHTALYYCFGKFLGSVYTQYGGAGQWASSDPPPHSPYWLVYKRVYSKYIVLLNKPCLLFAYYMFRPFIFNYQGVSITISYTDTIMHIIKAIMD